MRWEKRPMRQKQRDMEETVGETKRASPERNKQQEENIEE